jgi:predicted aspartyl protease
LIHSLEFSHLLEYPTGLPGITLTVRISVVGNSTEFDAKVDTGATDCVFAREKGEQIGLNIEAGRLVVVETATGVFKTFEHWVTLSCLDYDFDIPALFATDENYNRNVLGRIGFLNQVQLGLNDYEGKIYLSSLAESWS